MNPRDDREARIARVAARTDLLLQRGHRGQARGDSRYEREPNRRLADAMASAGVTPAELAKRIGVEDKTVERWIATGRTPYPVHQFAVEKELGVELSQLWPERYKTTTPLAQPEKENQRLREALFEARMTYQQLAERLNLEPKTVERWITKGRVPAQHNQVAAAIAVGVPDYELWPQPVRPELLAQEQTLRARGADQNASGADPRPEVSPRMRELMSWVRTVEPFKEDHILANPDQYRGPITHTSVADRGDFGRRRRSDGLEHTR